jgi:hypothetical protein
VRAVLVVVAVALSACGGGVIPAGGKCDDSEQCGPGLLCDTTQKPAICTTKLKNPPPDLAGMDAAGVTKSDLGSDEDMSATAHDMATKPEDLAKREDL